MSHYLNFKTDFGPGLEQFQQIRTIFRFLDPIQSYYSNLQNYYSNFQNPFSADQNHFSAADFYLLSIFKMLQIVLEIRKLVLFSKLNVLDFRKIFLNTFYKLYLSSKNQNNNSKKPQISSKFQIPYLNQVNFRHSVVFCVDVWFSIKQSPILNY